MHETIFMPTLHARLLADCLEDVADGELVRIGPSLQKSTNWSTPPYWRRYSHVTWVNSAYALRVIALQRPTEGWIIEPGLAPDVRLKVGTAILDHCAKHAVPPLLCMPRLYEDPNSAEADAFICMMKRKAARHEWQLASRSIVDSAGFSVSYASQAVWSDALTTRLSVWQRHSGADTPVLI